ncbi:MAG: asparagine synthase (glutamine-hydrolyzing) [Nitrospira sp.]|nr:asparagine synthase (glutamine-hydrolyzing) [Nitrospira sp.]
MCGIAGILNCRESDPGALVTEMIGAIRYRGPDNAGVWRDPPAGLALGHARLSVLDLSPEGRQPMVSASGRYVITYNGEVYNFAELRRELEAAGDRFRGHSDTEVMLAAIERWGLEQAVKKFVGMFAFGLWDRQARILYLVRDRLGIKPLYYGWAGGAFLFASELKAIRCATEFDATIDRGAVSLFMRFAYVPAPYSIYRDIYKLTPGCVLGVSHDQTPLPRSFSPSPDDQATSWKPRRYWSAREAAESGIRAPFSGSEADAIEQLDGLLRHAVKLRMVADVPLGAFLSGGIDSSLVVGLMQAQSHNPIRTFTIGFHESGYDEAAHARKVAAHLATDHTELYVTSEQAMAVIPGLPSMYDEPFGDSSQIPTYLVSELARRHVTVALSGDGGDELFAGYNRYFWGRQLWRRLSFVPISVRAMLASGLQSVSPGMWEKLYANFSAVLPPVQHPGDKVYKLASLLALESPDSMYFSMVSLWRNPAEVVAGTTEPKTVLTDRPVWATLPDFTLRMMYLDLMTYLPDDILTKIDRASMAVSLEARVPLLDHRVVEFAWSLPLSMKIRTEGKGKWALRQVLDRYVPKTLIERPKMGFGIPLDSWLRGPLRGWAEDLLAEERLDREGYFHSAPIRAKWAEHLSGQRNWQYLLWNVLMFQAWLSAHDRSPAAAVPHH